MRPLNIAYAVFLGGLGLVAALVIASALPVSGNFKILTVLSGSMEPAISTGSIVVVKPGAQYAIGDIITFRNPGGGKVPTTHRIVDLRIAGGRLSYFTKGDANNAPDSREVGATEIIGRVILYVPYLGYAVSVAQRPIGFLALIIIPAALVITGEVKKLARGITAAKRRKKNIGPKIKTVDKTEHANEADF